MIYDFRVGRSQGLRDLPLDKNSAHFSVEVKPDPVDEDTQGQFMVDLFGLGSAALYGATQIPHRTAFKVCYRRADHGCNVRVAGCDLRQRKRGGGFLRTRIEGTVRGIHVADFDALQGFARLRMFERFDNVLQGDAVGHWVVGDGDHVQSRADSALKRLAHAGGAVCAVNGMDM
jgi:hypothetical protein